MQLAPGMVLGRYELLVPVAQGGMATVWAARLTGSRGFQKTVAVKTMLPALTDDTQFERMFLDEAALASRVHHPNVAEILDLGEQEDVLYLVMEWVDGESLSVLMRTLQRNQGYLPQRIALRVARQACAGLHAAHELRDETDQPLDLVHRDVSPQNILVTYDGIVKLVDFGVAKAVGRAGGETVAGQLKGKARYMSPEQAKGGAVDRRTDVFAMGIVLYKMTTGKHPFSGGDDFATMRNIISRPVVPPRVHSPQFSPELEHVLLKALSKDPDRRYSSMLELDRALERVMVASGAYVGDDEVALFVRSALSERAQKRRAALRDAVRAADERAACGMMAPLVQDALSDIVLTQLASGVGDGVPSLRVPPGPASIPHGVIDLTNDAVSDVGELGAMHRGRRRVVVAFVAMCSTLVLGIAVLLVISRSSRAGASDARARVGADAPGAPVPIGSTDPAASAGLPSADATARASAPASASAQAAATSTPDEGASAAPKGRSAAAVSRAGRAPGKGAAVSTAGTSKSNATPWVPTIQNPGF